MVKQLFFHFLFLSSIQPHLSQTQAAINKLIIPAIDDGWMEAYEGTLISDHLLQYGWPIVAEEAWAIEGIRENVLTQVIQSDRWSVWCSWGAGELVSKSNDVSWNVTGMSEVGAGSTFVSRAKGSNWGLVIEREMGIENNNFIGGYYRNSLGNGVEYIIGDHRIHWGSGATVFRYDPFKSMRAPHNLSQISRDFSGVNSGEGTPRRRGLAVSKSNGNWWFSSSFDSQMRLGWGAFFKTPRLMLGVLGEIGFEKFDNIVGLVLRREINALSYESEISLFKGGASIQNRAVLACGKKTFVFCSLDKQSSNHPAIEYGEQSLSDSSWVGGAGFFIEENNRKLVVKSEIEHGKLNFRSTLSWDSDLKIGGELQSRLQVKGSYDGTLELLTRVKWDLHPVKFTGEIIHSGEKLSNIGKAFRVDIKNDRNLTVAVMEGGNDMLGRLYQLLPTARGYRLFSVGDSTRKAIITWEVVPDRVVISFEKVWPKAEVYEEKLSTQRISIRFDVR